MADRSWGMPKWMEPYREQIERYTSGGTVEEWMRDETSVAINAPRALIACNVKGMVTILTALHWNGLLDAERVAALEDELAAARKALHRCRSDFHAKVIALQKELVAARAALAGAPAAADTRDETA